MALNKVLRRAKIKRRIRKKVFGTSAIPRLTVFRSNKQIYAQIIDDNSGRTLASAGSLKMDDAQKVNKVSQAAIVGKTIAAAAQKQALNALFLTAMVTCIMVESNPWLIQLVKEDSNFKKNGSSNRKQSEIS